MKTKQGSNHEDKYENGTMYESTITEQGYKNWWPNKVWKHEGNKVVKHKYRTNLYVLK